MNTRTCKVTREMRRDDEAQIFVIASPTNGKQITLGRQPCLRALPLHTESPIWVWGDWVFSWWGSRWERVSNTGGSYKEKSAWFALRWVWPDASAGDRYIYSLQRLSSPALPWLPPKAIHPHTWIRNEIISLPPRALITQPWWLDGPGHTERAREQIERRKGWRWWTRTVEVLSFRVGNTEICYNRASGGGGGENKGLD